MSKVIGFSGSPRKDANTDRLVRQVLAGAAEAGAETKFFHVAELGVQGCKSCYHCKTHLTCSIPDGMQALLAEVLSADAVVLGTPVYMGQMSGQLKIFVDRLLPVMNADFSTRLQKHPTMVLALTQGVPDLEEYGAYATSTQEMFGFLGFTPGEVLVAGGTRAPADVEGQQELMARAKSVGAKLVRK